jgi:hypothetical protein
MRYESETHRTRIFGAMRAVAALHSPNSSRVHQLHVAPETTKKEGIAADGAVGRRYTRAPRPFLGRIINLDFNCARMF